jgi:hypothetical protein
MNGEELHTASFEFYAPAAHDVFLVGEFNGWDPRATPMQRTADGNWRIELPLRPGMYRYKFMVDSIWRCSSHEPHDRCDLPCQACPPRCVPNLHGSFDRVAVVAGSDS